MRNQLKVFRHQNEKLLQENLDQKEEIDILNVKCGEQNERIQHFKLQLSSLSSEQEDLNSLREKQFKQLIIPKFASLLVNPEHPLRAFKYILV